MTVHAQIKSYISSIPIPKQNDLEALHAFILSVLPGCKLQFYDGKNNEGKTVSNPTIGYGTQMIKYANGKSREYFQIGLSANKTGISVYILGIRDKTYLSRTFGTKIGKASITGYCIKFNALKNINLEILGDAVRYGVEVTLRNS
ncbi:MAG: DUF1801 domain-containing protein [Bacteroidota bacterium]|nr:DUF1801 domain-containing protein [Bacteroidota bacterium]